MIRPIRQRFCFDNPSEHQPMRDNKLEPDVVVIAALLKERGKSHADVGRLLGLDSSQVSRIFNGRRRLQLHEAKQIHAWLGNPESIAEAGGTVIPMPGMIPLYGWVGASSENRLQLAEQSIRGFVPMHPRQATTRDAFALEVSDISMSPRYEPGEIIYLAPNRWPAKQQDGVIVTTNGHGFLKRFVRRDNNRLVFHQLNPEREIEFDISELANIHAVVGRD